MDRGRNADDEGTRRQLTCRFEDGRVLRVTVTPAEAEALVRHGVPVSRARRFAIFLGSHSGWWIGIVIAALIAPAIGKQWSDRNQELSLKNGLVASLSSSAATSITTAEEVARHRGSALDCQNALDAWTRTQSSLTGSFVVYFPGGAVDRLWSNTVKRRQGPNWIGFRTGVYEYIELSCYGMHPDRYVDDLSLLLGAFGLEVSPRDRMILANRDREPRERFVGPFHRLGLQIFEARNEVLHQLALAHAEGFSRGWGDFIHNVSHPVG